MQRDYERAVSMAAPTYVVVDTSWSMSGISFEGQPPPDPTPLDSAHKAFVTCISKFQQNKIFRKLVHLSIVTFADQAHLHMPLRPLESLEFDPPEPFPDARGQTDYRELFLMLRRQVLSDAEKLSSAGVGIKNPAFFILTDGISFANDREQEVETWKPALDSLRELTIRSGVKTRSCWLVPFGLGDIREETLCEIKSPGIPAVIATDRAVTAEVTAQFMTAIVNSTLESANRDRPIITIPPGCREARCQPQAAL